eukprot:Plantae.Rhodophyta-Purpureofilum_apyrenoidigerum.ctg23154.p1 GENE.Plantae.Rhodophyta-Purpureofilum_apyrenoidigerum.ctg23154~~Plantae.Rhodophyta-Purpureofilum_apyrenoidigerum.ctg23154.p1  ORF type:complete len:225 (-),score=43.61 Plantae.Rhodophyta-Purpureofilum_apyrenoidigerum.ctg23154:129-803(-)
MSFTLPKLPYEYGSLEPHIDSTTMNIHHTKHHNTYINNVNGVINGENGSAVKGLSLEAMQKSISTLPDSIKTAVRNNGGGHYNHSMFWTTMAGVGSSNSGPTGDLKSAIDSTFGSTEAMQKEFNAAAATRFGSGWAWLCVDDSQKLYITSTPNQDNPLMTGIADKPGTPILGLDVWEHAYYLKYQNRRPEYIQAFWNVVNWDKVVENYGSACNGGTAQFDVPLS